MIVPPSYEDQSHKLIYSKIKEITEAYVSKDVSVQISSITHERYGDIKHFWIRRHDGKPLGWTQLQRIKNDIAGNDALAIQVFPKEKNKVDQANMYHLWVFENDFGVSECGFIF